MTVIAFGYCVAVPIPSRIRAAISQPSDGGERAEDRSGSDQAQSGEVDAFGAEDRSESTSRRRRDRSRDVEGRDDHAVPELEPKYVAIGTIATAIIDEFSA